MISAIVTGENERTVSATESKKSAILSGLTSGGNSRGVGLSRLSSSNKSSAAELLFLRFRFGGGGVMSETEGDCETVDIKEADGNGETDENSETRGSGDGSGEDGKGVAISSSTHESKLICVASSSGISTVGSGKA